MKFAISLEIDTEAQYKASLIHSMSNEINVHLQSQSLGDGILNYFIGCICIKTKPGYEQWYRERKPRYRKSIMFKPIFETKEKEEIRNIFTCDIKIDGNEYDDFVKLSDNRSEIILAKKILDSLENLRVVPKTGIDFDRELFVESIKSYFEERGLI